ncbi:MAG: DUF3368 domain-containing protein [Bacteroidota bacterium]
MPEVIIADTSCLIILDKIGRSDLLKSLYGKISITKEIEKEFGLHLPDWIVIQNHDNNSSQLILEQTLDKGEASAIALALKYPNSLVILDDLKARKIASSLNLRITGTLGIMLKAKQKGIISDLKPLIAELQKSDFYISSSIIDSLLEDY